MLGRRRAHRADGRARQKASKERPLLILAQDAVLARAEGKDGAAIGRHQRVRCARCDGDHALIAE